MFIEGEKKPQQGVDDRPDAERKQRREGEQPADVAWVRAHELGDTVCDPAEDAATAARQAPGRCPAPDAPLVVRQRVGRPFGNAHRIARRAQGPMHPCLEFAHVHAAVVIWQQCEVAERLGIVAPTPTRLLLLPCLVQSCSQLDHAGIEVPVTPLGCDPQRFERLVAVPERAGVEQAHAVAPGVRRRRRGVSAGGGAIDLGITHGASIGEVRYRDGVPPHSDPDQHRASLAAAPLRLTVAISGGSGVHYARDLLLTLVPLPVEVHLVVTSGAKQVFAAELDGGLADVLAAADEVHNDSDLGASIASGSFRTHGMVVVPCSAGTLAKVALGLTDNLTSRAAHVTLKERRPLVLVVREAPYPRPMLRNMLAAHDAGATIMPASPGFYHRPSDIDALIGTITARTLDHLAIDHDRAPRWKEPES